MHKTLLIMSVFLTLNAYAACQEEGFFDCGTTGDVKWYLSNDKTTLSIKGNGEMSSYSAAVDGSIYTTTAPWGQYKSSIQHVDVQSGVTGLGTYAFLGMDQVRDVSLPEGLQSIGRSSFNRCRSLSEINIPSTVTYIAQYAVQFTDIESVVVPDSVTRIDEFAFGYNDKLKSIVVGDQVNSISASAFKGSENAYVYCQESNTHGGKSCAELLGSTGIVNGKLKIYTVENGKIKVGSKIYNSLDDLPKYVKRRIYTVKEAEEAAGNRNTVTIRYR